MSAGEVTPPPLHKLGIIAGGGALPGMLARECRKRGIEPLIVAFKGQADPLIDRAGPVVWSRPGAAGRILKMLKQKGVRDLVLIGSLKRPSLAELCPDWRAARFFAKLGLRALGDSDLLSAVRAELETEGFRLHGIQDFIQDLLAPEGPITRQTPGPGHEADILRGLEVSQALGVLDIGQAVIVQEGIVLGVEAAEGTAGLIARCAGLRREGRGGVLVKTCKPQQDRDLDLPTIGPDTVDQCAAAGLSGIAVQAGRSLLVDLAEIVEKADRNGMFVVGAGLKP